MCSGAYPQHLQYKGENADINKIIAQSCNCFKCCEGKSYVLFELIIDVFDIVMVVRETCPEEIIY